MLENPIITKPLQGCKNHWSKPGRILIVEYIHMVLQVLVVVHLIASQIQEEKGCLSTWKSKVQLSKMMALLRKAWTTTPLLKSVS